MTSVTCVVPPAMQEKATVLVIASHPTKRFHFSAPASRPAF